MRKTINLFNVYFLMFFISLIAFLWPLLQEFDEISLIDFIYASIIFFVVISIQFLMIIVIDFSTEKLKSYNIKSVFIKIIQQFKNIIIAIWISLNIFYFCLLLMDMQISTMNYVAFALMPVIYIILGNEKLIRFSVLFGTMFLLISVVQYASLFFIAKAEKPKAPLSMENYEYLYALKNFTNKRNIYMISYDSVVSPESLRKFYGLTKTGHFDYLQSAGFRILDSAFSGGGNTRMSFHSMMRLKETQELIQTPNFFSTRQLNPAYTLFGKLDYKVQFLFHTQYMGSNTNTLDYFFPEEKFITLCDFIHRSYGYFACDPNILFKIAYNSLGKNITIEDFFKKVLERISAINTSKDEPWITIAHIWYPGHAPRSLSYKDLSGKEKEIHRILQSYPRLEEMIRETVATIHAADDDPVIFIYSDHGAWLTNGLWYGEENPIYSAEEIYLEKNGIMFAVYPHDFCAERFIEGYNTANLMSDMLDCELAQSRQQNNLP